MGILETIASNIEIVHIVLFAVGVICLILEMFEPGFGFFGGAGVVLMIIDVLILANNMVEGIVLLAGVFLLVLVFVIVMIILASYGVLPKKLVLKDKVISEKSFAPIPELHEGDVGETVTLLRPSGKAKFSEKIYDVVSNGEFIENGTEIVVLSITTNKITVCRK